MPVYEGILNIVMDGSLLLFILTTLLQEEITVDTMHGQRVLVQDVQMSFALS